MTTTITEPTTPLPGPMARLGRCLGVSLGVAVLLIPLWYGWRYRADKLLQAQIALCRAANQPVYLSEFAAPPVDPNLNRATYWQAAMSAISLVAYVPSQSNMTYADYPPYSAQWHAMTDKAMVADARALALARQARSTPHLDWHIVYRSPAWITLLPPLSQCRALAEVLGDAALDAHLRGNDAEAIERIRDMLQLGRDTSRLGCFLINRLVAVGIDALALDRLKVIAPSLQTNPNPRMPGAAERGAIVGLIHQLLDEQADRQEQQACVVGERAMTLDFLVWKQQKFPMLSPLFTMQSVEVIKAYAPIVQAAQAPDLTASLTILSAMPASPMMVSWPRYLTTEWRVRSERRCAAISLAVRLYYLDHHRWPPDLQSLVPAYLPAVPANPFLPGDPPMGYMIVPRAAPTFRDRPVLFFDTRATPGTATPPAQPSYGWSIATRQWRDLSCWYLNGQN